MTTLHLVMSKCIYNIYSLPKTKPTKPKPQFFFLDQQNSMDLCKTAIVGHSFGGATVIEALCKEVKFKYVD